MVLSEALVHTRIRRLVVNLERRDCLESTAVRDEHPAVKTLSFCTFVIPFFYSFFLIWLRASLFPPAPTFPPKCSALDVFLLALTFSSCRGVCVCVCEISEVCTSLPSG